MPGGLDKEALNQIRQERDNTHLNLARVLKTLGQLNGALREAESLLEDVKRETSEERMDYIHRFKSSVEEFINELKNEVVLQPN